MSELCAFVPERWGLQVIRCRGCRRELAFSTTYRTPTYCDELCANDYPTGDNEDRNALLYDLSRCAQVPQLALSQMFGIARQWVNKLINDRTRLR